MGLPVGSALDHAQVAASPAAPAAGTVSTFVKNGRLYTQDSSGQPFLAGSVRELEPVVVATLANITLSGTQTINGVAVAAGDRVLVLNQTTTTENGIWVAAAGAWTRAPDADTAAKVARGTQVSSLAGSTSTLRRNTRFTQWTPITTFATDVQQWRSIEIVELANPFNYPANPYNGQMLFDVVRGQGVVWDNVSWKPVGGILVGTSTTYPATSGKASIFYETDTGVTKIYDGTTWQTIGSGGSSDAGPYKQQRARVAALANVSITAPGATIDGVTLVAGDRVLLTAQTAPAQNGIWTWNGAAAAMTRTTDADSVADIVGAFVVVNEGTTAAGREYKLFMPSNGTLNTTAIIVTFERDGGWYGNPFGIAPLDENAKVPLANLPSSATGEIESWGANSTASLSMTTNVWTDVPGCAVTVPVTASTDRFLVVANADCEIVSAGAIGFMGLVAGPSAGFGELAFQGTASSRTMLGQNWIMTGLPPGNNVFKLRAMNYTGAGTAAFYANSTKFSVVKLQSNSGGSVSAATQAGAISMWAKATPPSGWLLCNGGTFSSVTYPELATVLGDTYGTHSGTTYYLPDMDTAAPGTNLQHVLQEINISSTGPYSATAPGPTTGTQFTVNAAGTFSATVNATTYATTSIPLTLDIYIDGAQVARMNMPVAHSGVNAHVTLPQTIVTSTLSAGTHYIYLRNVSGASDFNDTWSMNARVLTPEKAVAYIVKTASDSLVGGGAEEASQVALTSGNANITIAGATVYRRGLLGVVNINATANAAVTTPVLTNLPAGYRPAVSASESVLFSSFAMVVGSTESTIRSHTYNTGEVVLQGPVPSGALLRGSFTFPIAPTGSVGGAVDTGWIAASLQNSWTYYGAPYTPPAYRKVGNKVMIRGFVRNGTQGTSIFTLPTGFQPPYLNMLSGMTNQTQSGAAVTGTAHTHYMVMPMRVDINTSGAVIPQDSGMGAGAWISLDGMEFYVD